MVTSVQVDPFHCSMRIELAPDTVAYPTATQNDVVTHETLTSVSVVAPVTVGRVIGDHVVPFQSSA